MEEAENLSVISLDLTKAYNLLAREMLKRTNRTFGTPVEVIDSYFAFLDAVQRSFLVYGTLSDQQSSKTGVPEGCAFAVYNMLQLNWVVSTYLDMRQEEQSSVTFISYVDNWLLRSYHLGTLREAYNSVYLASEAFGFVISPGKTWASSTSKDLRKTLQSWFPQNPEQVVHHKQELGCLLRFSKQPSIQDALPRWEDGLCRIDRLTHQKWNTARKIQVIRQGVFPQLFSGCETFHISLSTFKKFRAKLNVAVHGKKTRGSHYLSPIFTHLLDYKPFLYVFATRLSSLRSTVMSFQTPAREAWNYARSFDLNAQYQTVHGPVAPSFLQTGRLRPKLPQALRSSSWSVVAARDKLAPIHTIVSGLTSAGQRLSLSYRLPWLSRGELFSVTTPQWWPHGTTSFLPTWTCSPCGGTPITTSGPKLSLSWSQKDQRTSQSKRSRPIGRMKRPEE